MCDVDVLDFFDEWLFFEYPQEDVTLLQISSQSDAVFQNVSYHIEALVFLTFFSKKKKYSKCVSGLYGRLGIFLRTDIRRIKHELILQL